MDARFRLLGILNAGVIVRTKNRMRWASAVISAHVLLLFLLLTICVMCAPFFSKLRLGGAAFYFGVLVRLVWRWSYYRE